MSTRKMTGAWLFLVLVTLLLIALAGCGTQCAVHYYLGEHASEEALVPVQADVRSGEIITLPEAPPAQIGWKFVAWSNGKLYPAGASFVVEKDVTFTAMWERDISSPDQSDPPVLPAEHPEPVTVLFSPGRHATGEPLSQVVERGTTLSLPTPPVAERGYAFDGWYHGEQKLSGDFVVRENMTITARVLPIVYHVRYLGLEGATQDNATEYTVETPPFSLKEPGRREGFFFLGWFTEEGEEVRELDPSLAKDLTLYARWSLKTAVATEGEFMAAFANAGVGTTLSLAGDVTLTQHTLLSFGGEDRSLTIDLNGHALTFSGRASGEPFGIRLEGEQTAAFCNGELRFSAVGGEEEPVLFLGEGSRLSLKNVRLTSTLSGLLLEGGTLDMVGGSVVVKGRTALQIRPSSAGERGTMSVLSITGEGPSPVLLSAEGGERHSGTALLAEDAGTATLTHVTLQGARQAAVVRMGKATFQMCTFTRTGEYVAPFDENIWGEGNEVPASSLVIGDTDPAAYSSPADVTLVSCTFTPDPTAERGPIVLAADAHRGPGLVASCVEQDKVFVLQNDNEILVRTRFLHATPEEVKEVAATCNSPGVRAHFRCGQCGTKFRSADAGVGATDPWLTIPPTGVHGAFVVLFDGTLLQTACEDCGLSEHLWPFSFTGGKVTAEGAFSFDEERGCFRLDLSKVKPLPSGAVIAAFLVGDVVHFPDEIIDVTTETIEVLIEIA